MRRAISVILGGVKRSVGIIKYDIVVMENVMLIMMTRAGGSQGTKQQQASALIVLSPFISPGLLLRTAAAFTAGWHQKRGYQGTFQNP